MDFLCIFFNTLVQNSLNTVKCRNKQKKTALDVNQQPSDGALANFYFLIHEKLKEKITF